jgi:hypothetical protein
MLDIVVCFVKMYPALDRYQNNFIEKAVMNNKGTRCPGKAMAKSRV